METRAHRVCPVSGRNSDLVSGGRPAASQLVPEFAQLRLALRVVVVTGCLYATLASCHPDRSSS